MLVPGLELVPQAQTIGERGNRGVDDEPPRFRRNAQAHICAVPDGLGRSDVVGSHGDLLPAARSHRDDLLAA